LRALAERLRERQIQREYRDQQRDPLVEFPGLVFMAAAMPIVFNLMLDLVLNRVNPVTHVASPND
jgi:hypothetical protein